MEFNIYNNVPVTNIGELVQYYMYNNTDRDPVRNCLATHLIKGKDYWHLSGNEAMQFSVKKSSGAGRGLNVFRIDSVIELSKSYSTIEKKINIPKLKKDYEEFLNIGVSTTDSDEISTTTNLPFDEVYALVDRMTERQMIVLEQFRQENAELKNIIESLTDKVNELSKALENQTEITINKVSESSVFDTPIILKENVSYEEWLKGINRACDLIIKIDNTKNKTSILHEAYDRIRAQYGIVWEQEAKEFKAEFERGPINTRELCWWMETTKKNCKNLLIGKLNTIYSETRRAAYESNIKE